MSNKATLLRRSGPPERSRAGAPLLPQIDPNFGGGALGVKNARTAAIEPNEQGAVGPTHTRLAWRALPLDIELMPQYQDFGLPAAAATRKAIAIMRTIVLIRS